MSTDETCPKIVLKGDTWHPIRRACGKPVKRNGLCGVHARLKDHDAARDARWAEERKDQRRAEEIAAAIRLHDLNARSAGNATVVFDLADAEGLLVRLVQS